MRFYKNVGSRIGLFMHVSAAEAIERVEAGEQERGSAASREVFKWMI